MDDFIADIFGCIVVCVGLDLIEEMAKCHYIQKES